MKTRIVIIVSACLSFLRAAGQEWVGNLFTLDTIVEMKSVYAPENLNLIKCKMQGNTFYFVEQQGFQSKSNSYQAVIHALSTDNYEQTEIVLPLPENVRNKERYARSLWIYDFSFDGDYLLVTTQEELILYQRIINQNYRVRSVYRHQNLYMGFLHRNKIHIFEEEHDKGFKWFQQDLDSDSATLVRELPYEAPHIVQIQPNRYIFHNQQSVFFLSTRFPRLEVYDLEGHLQDTIHFQLPHWKAFEDEYIRKTLTVPYGIERIYAVKDDLYDYSYAKVAIPLDGDILLLYMQFDTLTGKSALQYAIHTEDGATRQYLRTNHEDSAYLAARFPFTLFQGGFDKGNASEGNYLVQLTYKTDVPWEGKSNRKYMNEVNQYFSEKQPVLAYKVMRYSPQNKIEPALFTSNGDQVTLHELPAEKSILLLHQDLECSGCVKALYNLLEFSATDSIHLGHVYPNPVRGLQAYELTTRIRRDLNKPFTLYYDTSDHYVQLSPALSLQDRDFPCLMLYEKGKPPRLFRSNEIFTDNFSITEFQENFLNAWRSFIEQ
jgi:hypothetical protein